MTGAMLGRRLLRRSGIEGVAVRRGAVSCYLPEERVVILASRCYDGSSQRAWTVVAHEIGHAVQAQRWGRWVAGLRVLMLGRLWLEWDASRWARRLMAREGLVVDDRVLRESWESYAWPAFGQVGVLAGVLGWVVMRPG